MEGHLNPAQDFDYHDAKTQSKPHPDHHEEAGRVKSDVVARTACDEVAYMMAFYCIRKKAMEKIRLYNSNTMISDGQI